MLEKFYEKLKNPSGEKLEYVIEGNKNASEVVIFVHGFLMDMDGGNHLFPDISQVLQKDFLVLRFSQSGCGNSEGREEDYCLSKSTKDLKSVIKYCNTHFPDKKIHIIAFSLGTHIVAGLEDISSIDKVIMASITGSDGKNISERMKKRILHNGGYKQENGTYIYPRSSGATNKVGDQFRKDLEEKISLKNFKKFPHLTMIEPLQDLLIQGQGLAGYKTLGNVQYLQIDGGHGFKKKEDREGLIRVIQDILLLKQC